MLDNARRLRPSHRLRRAAACAPLIAAVLLVPWPVHAAAAFHSVAPLPGLGSGRVWDVAVDPALPSRVLAATDSGVYLSVNGGATWQQTLTSQRVWTVGFDVRNAQNVLAGSDGAGVFASSDAGSTWAAASSGLPNPDVRSLAFGLEGFAAGTDSGVAVSPDGRTWHADGLSGYSISALAVAANSPKLTLVAGTDNGDLSGGYLFRGAVGGPWTALTNGLPSGAVISSLSAGPIDQAVPHRPLLAATTKGLFRSGDSGNTWTASTGVTATLGITTVGFSPLDPNLAYAGADAGGSTGGDLLRSTDSGQTFAPADAGLPQSSRNVEAIGFGETNPITVVVALDPPAKPAAVYAEVDTSAPSPPTLIAEVPGASVPKVVATPTPSPTAAPRQPAATVPVAQPNGALQALGNVFHWPVPLVYEVVLVLLIVYGAMRWRQHYYVEGPP